MQKERVEAKGARFIDIRHAFANPQGSYTDTGPDDTGEFVRLRSRDGVHFFKQGNNRLAQLVLEAIKQSPWPAAKPAAPPACGRAAQCARCSARRPTEGSDQTLRSPIVKVADASASDAIASGSADHSPAPCRSLAVRSAEKLFAGEARQRRQAAGRCRPP